MTRPRPRTSLCWLLVLPWLACSESTDVDSTSIAVILGTAFDARGETLPNTGIQTSGNRYNCEEPALGGLTIDGTTTTDGAGGFRIEVSSFLGSPGIFCLDLVVGDPASAADTVRGVEAEFFRLGETVQETSGVELRTDL